MLLTCCATSAASPVGSLSASCKGARLPIKAASFPYSKRSEPYIPHSLTQDMQTWGSQSQHPHPRCGRGGYVSYGPQVERRWSAGLLSHDSGCTPAFASQQLLGMKRYVCICGEGYKMHTAIWIGNIPIITARPFGSTAIYCPGTILRQPLFPNVSWCT